MNAVNYDIKNEVITIQVNSDLYAESIWDIAHQIESIRRYFKLELITAKVLVLVDNSARIHPDAISVVSETLDGLEFMAAAIVRRGGFDRSSIDLILRNLLSRSHINAFDDAETAQKWLHNLKAIPSQLI